jgi:Zn-dependent protease
LSDELVAAIIVVAIMLLIGFPVHEFAHAFAAYRLGDGTAKLFGRLTLDPRAHFDPVGGTLLAITFLSSIGFGFGWAKPTPVNPMNLAYGRRGEAIVAAAGPLSNLILAAAAAIPLRYIVSTPELWDSLPSVLFSVSADGFLGGALYFFVIINLILMIFNLVPIPPLDGSKVLFAFLDRRTEYQVRPFLEQYGFLILIAFLFFPFGDPLAFRVIRPVLNAFFSLLVGV